MAFENSSGTAIPAADVRAAEGNIAFEGVLLAETPGGLSATLPTESLKRIKSIEALRPLFPHYAVSSVRDQAGLTLVTLRPLFIYAGDLKIAISDGAGRAVLGCDLSLHVDAARQAGSGWGKIKPAERPSGLKFHQSGSGYVPVLPADAGRNELLIGTAQPGDAARLSNAARGCELEARPNVTSDELRTGAIARSLRKAGPILIAILSADGDLSGSAGVAAPEAFWARALDLAGAVSDEPFERKLLARAQSLAGPETHLLEDLGGNRKLAEGDLRERLMRQLVEGSSTKPGPLAMLKQKPIERFQLDLALRSLREKAAIDPQDSVQQEALLLVTGGGGLWGSYFCGEPMAPSPALPASAQWRTQARRVFAIEVWSKDAAASLSARSRASQPEGGPEGVYLCRFAAGDGNLALYGVVPAALSASSRDSTFAFLTAQAKAYLKP